MASTGNDPAANSGVDAGSSQPLTDTPTHDASEAGQAAHSPVDDARRPCLIAGLDAAHARDDPRPRHVALTSRPTSPTGN